MCGDQNYLDVNIEKKLQGMLTSNSKNSVVLPLIDGAKRISYDDLLRVKNILTSRYPLYTRHN